MVMVSLLAAPLVQAQSLEDVASIRVDELSDEQVRAVMRKAADSGLSSSELIEMAKAQGMSEAEAQKLKNRIQAIELGSSEVATAKSTPNDRKPREQVDASIIRQNANQVKAAMQEAPALPLFGMDLFYQKDRNLTFEPSLSLATPSSYILGPGDMVYIDIYGASENYYESTVTPEGKILLENIGPIAVSGLSIVEAKKLIQSRMARYYEDLQGPNPATFMEISLGNIRSIKVHMVGELRLPGTFTLSAFSSVFNALYAAGGPNQNGTMRNIRVMRNNRQVAIVDAYDFLINGKANMNFQLQDQDVILVEPYQGRVTVEGAVKRPMVYEVKGGESFEEILAYAGGFTENAYTQRVSVTRLTPKEKAVSDVYQEQFGIFTVQAGDRYEVGKILDRYTNRVQLKGAVFRPGNYAWSEGLKLSQLIQKADGLKGDAYLPRATVLRAHEDLSTSIIPVNLQAVANGQEDLLLQAEDIIRISSVYDLKDEYYLKISGEVRDPGIYPYAEGMTAEDLILLAGGFSEAAATNNVEIARRNIDQAEGEMATLIPVQVNSSLSLDGSSEKLMPYDNIIVRGKPNFALDRVVMVEGQVNAPGEFALKSADERISDVINRAGGLTSFAYANGATLIRRTEYYDTESERLRREKNNVKLLERVATEDPSDAQNQQILRLLEGSPEGYQESNRDARIQYRHETLQEISQGEGASIKIKQQEAIAIDLKNILENPGSKFDLILEEGDIITVPKQLQTVRLRGEVIYPTTVRYENNQSMKYYIDRAGGFDNRAKRKRTYVVYANGEVARTKTFFFINTYPRIEPGVEVIVPSKGPRVPLRVGEIIGLTSGLATLALVISQINFNSGSGN